MLPHISEAVREAAAILALVLLALLAGIAYMVVPSIVASILGTGCI